MIDDCSHRWTVTIDEGGNPQSRCNLCGAVKPEKEVRQIICLPHQNDANIGTSAENIEREIGELKKHVANVKKYRARLKLLEKALKILREL